jgi:hypothetical protein
VRRHRATCMADTWYRALSIIADYAPAAYWCMSNGAEFWWTPSHSHLGQDRFTGEPFGYEEIVSVSVFDSVRMGNKVLTCNWQALREQLLDTCGLNIAELRDVSCPPATPPNSVLLVTAPHDGVWS